MTVSVEKVAGLCMLRIEGEMNIYNAAELKKSLAEKTAECGSIAMDLSGVSEMDTSGLQLLIMLKKEATASNKGFRIDSGSPSVKSVVELFNLQRFFCVG